MASSRGVYHNFSVDYVVIRGGKQELDADSLLRNGKVMDKDFNYDVVLDLDSSSGGEYATPLDQERLVNVYTQFITDRLEHLRTTFPFEQRRTRTLFVSSSYIPRPLIGITGARTEMISCFFNCFCKVYVVNGEVMCYPEYVDKWSVDKSLPSHLQVAHDALDSYIPVKLSEAKALAVWSGDQKDDIQLDWYDVYTEDHITYIKMSHFVMRLSLKWISQVKTFDRKPNCEYEIQPCGGIAFVREYHSLKSGFMLNKLIALLADIF